MKSLILFSIIAFITTFSGSALTILKEAWTQRHLWRLLAFSSGVLLGIAFLHLMPEAFGLAGQSAGVTILGTFVILFAAENVTMVHACEDFLRPKSMAPLVPVTALIALSAHAFIDGMVIGVGLHRNMVLGSIISVGVILHKFSDGLTLTSLLRAAGYSKGNEYLLGCCVALATPLGAIMSYHFTGQLPPSVVGFVLAVATGSFIYVGAADLLPRLHEAHDRLCLLFLLIGVILVGAIY